ncbi:YkgJ family cysteine cluster protein [Polyangium aurulentum]|uniref:YkgJ family cysteine cluster protein n=1 Tax=Polyangium aurulentum TaxID=2567896 RepID=UPI0010ADBD7A|nr:YkgJ family cysteine cluster protein [Polyangium aurulentum]UQA57611.1 YkgJ family cysteine cluster protein [Polyangium aurulentum]
MENPEKAPSPRERLGELFAKVDAFFARARARHGEAITCRAGCDDCCRRRFSVTALEADAIREVLSRLGEDQRRALARRAEGGDPGVCPALDPDGRCAVYEARPLICRTHGLPIRFPSAKGARALPVLDACPKNFEGQSIGSLDPSTVLDQQTLSTVLAALDAAHADDLGKARGERVDIAALLLEG